MLTDSAGRWQTPLLPAYAQDFALRVDHPEYLPKKDVGAAEPVTINLLREQRAVITLEHACALSGRVVGSDGKAVAEARVALGGSGKPSPVADDEVVPTCYTDAAGRFRIAGLRPGTGLLAVRFEAHAPALLTVDVGPDTPPVEVQLTDGEVLRGRVVDEEGRPIQGVRVSFNEWNGADASLIRYIDDTDGEGRHVWNHAPRGTVKLDYEKVGYLPKQMSLAVPPATDYQVTLVRAANPNYRPDTGPP